MLRQLRSADKLKRVLWIGLLIIIIPSFIAFYGAGSGDLGLTSGRNQTMVTINYPNGTPSEIKPNDLRMAKNYLEQRVGQYAQMQGTMMAPDALRQMVNDKAIVDQAVNLDILRHYAEANDLTVSADEVLNNLKEGTTAEQRRMFSEQLVMQGSSIETFVEEQRKGQVIDKAMSSIGAQARVTNYEAWQEYIKDNEKLVANFYKVSPTDFLSSVTVTEEGLNTYFKENEEKFRIPDQVEYEYVLVRKDDLKSSITLTDDQITSYYTSNQEEFRLPRKVEARQVFLKLPSPEELNTTSAETLTSITEAVMAKADDVYERAAKGENFSQLAGSLSEEENFPPRADEGTTATDNATTAGGYLGLISEDVATTWYGEQWTSSVFSMQPGSITRPIRTANGVAVVQVERIIEGEIQPLDQVRQIVENRLRDQLVEPIFAEVGEKLSTVSGNVTGLQQIADATTETVVTSQKVNSGEKFIPGVGLLGEFEDAIADLEKGGRSDVLSDSQRHLVIQIKEEFPSNIPPLAEVKGRVEQAYKQALAEEAAKAKAEELLKKSQSFEAFQAALTDMGTTYTTSRAFTRPEAQTVFGGAVTDFAEKTSGAKPGEILMLNVGRPGQQQSYVVAHLAEVTEPSKEEFAKQLDDISGRILQRKRDILVLEYIRDQRKKLADKIDLHPSMQ